VTRVGHPERDRAAEALRRHYVAGRLSEEELARRTEIALAAHSRRELRSALVELPPAWLQVEETVLPSLREAGERVRHLAVVVVSAFVVWLMLSVSLLVLLVAVAADDGASLALVGFPLAWLVATVVLYRKAAASRPRRRR
jgi:uncharacterized protein DUF1707